MSSAGYTDIRAQHWVQLLPLPWRYYALLMRLDRPIGTWLLLLPGLWALALTQAPLGYYLLFAVGAVVMRGAGCVINDMWDRDIDRQVERTRNRPLASGALRLRDAALFLLMLLLIGLLILSWLNDLSVGLGVLALLLVVTYPLMKRITWWPQAFLGFTFNWGVLMGAAAVTGHLPLWVWPLYAAGVLWTLGYDTIYAHADVQDDALIGVKSTARRLGAQSRRWIAGFYAGAGVLVLLAGLMLQLGWGFYLILALVAGQVAHMLWSWKMDDPADCILCFRTNYVTGLLLLAAFMSGQL